MLRWPGTRGMPLLAERREYGTAENVECTDHCEGLTVYTSMRIA